MSRQHDPEVERIATQLGKRVRFLRESVSLTQSELATRIGHTEKTGTSYILRVEKGEKDVSLSTIARLAKALHTTPSKLLEGVE